MDDKSNLRIQREILYQELTANQKFDPENYITPYEPGLHEWSGWVDTQNPGIEGTGAGEADQHRLRVIPETRGERILGRIGLGLLFLVLVFVLYIAVIMIGINIEAALKGW